MSKNIRLTYIALAMVASIGLSGLIKISLTLAQSTTSSNTSTSPSSLQQKIDQRNADIKNLEKEIANYQKQISTLDSQATSLSSTVKSLDLTQKKLAADILVTENKIAAQNLRIQQLSTDITHHKNNIADDRRIIAHTFNTIDQSDKTSIIETVLGSDSVSTTLHALDDLGSLQKELYLRIDQIAQNKADLESTKTDTEKARATLLALNKQLKDQHTVVSSTKSAQNKLLADTKQSESSYQKILAQKTAQKDAFEREITDYESQLKINVDKEKIPHSGSGVLSWPLDSIAITQYFGNTDFATANPQIYNGKGHTGVDFRASIGTPIKAALNGVVSGTGNSDLVKGCYSFGKWVMVKHPNGLSTLYAHLSLPVVSTGQSVTTGQLLGYSGNTGYTTGPHLHFGVYATEGVVIGPLTSSVNCHNAIIPIAPFKAYLNPLSYL